MIELQYFTQDDFDQLIRWVDSEKFLIQWAGPSFSYPLDKSQLNDYLGGANDDHADKLIYKVVHTKTGTVVGHISLARIDRENRSARIGRVLVGDQSYRGQGICRQMIERIVRIAFEDIELHRVSLGVFDFNDSAISCYQKAGFKKEGLLRDYRKVGDEYWSLWEMSLLEHEWSARNN
ncbi:aminoglycoside N(6')-acetyltransferase [Thalassobacillus devorans]|uniref:Aminoglycoside N(6')-acetyltransferase n=1 Tax=Thalassobacillus devorans TaxID=279813 RepID=A0ABQ1PKU4_9BACI|nr:GNAT family protein [Thalassobacillus devorans]NIK30147.1 RimJ/RimL family protein N-acetyltransferase [Thalassobacillus devorans]GGC98718.1 aminoglycoside N(6')-acetyltransferase [Thalassobacillus devorans]